MWGSGVTRGVSPLWQLSRLASRPAAAVSPRRATRTCVLSGGDERKRSHARTGRAPDTTDEWVNLALTIFTRSKKNIFHMLPTVLMVWIPSCQYSKGLLSLLLSKRFSTQCLTRSQFIIILAIATSKIKFLTLCTVLLKIYFKWKLFGLHVSISLSTRPRRQISLREEKSDYLYGYHDSKRSHGRMN